MITCDKEFTYEIVSFKYGDVTYHCICRGISVEYDGEVEQSADFITNNGLIYFSENLDAVKRYSKTNKFPLDESTTAFDVEFFRNWAARPTKRIKRSTFSDFWSILDTVARTNDITYLGNTSETLGLYKKLCGVFNAYEKAGYYPKGWTDWGIAAIKDIFLEGIEMLDEVFLHK